VGAKIFALEREVVGFPRCQDKVEGIFEAFAAFFLRNVKPDVIEREGAPPDPQLEPPIAENVSGRCLLDDLQRVVQRQ
jgi:hypothetical protein